MILPSKELLSAVLESKLTYVQVWSHNDNTIGYETECCEYYINIYELMHEMKEFAYSKYSYELQSYSNGNGICYIFFKDAAYGEYEGFYKEDTEPEAVTKACEWILEKQK